MPKIIKATDYGYRKVIVVCLNPDEPESVHADGAPHTGGPPLGADPNLRPWEWCKECRYNWRVQEFIFDLADQSVSEGADARRMTDQELLAIVRTRLASPPSPETIPSLTSLLL